MRRKPDLAPGQDRPPYPHGATAPGPDPLAARVTDMIPKPRYFKSTAWTLEKDPSRSQGILSERHSDASVCVAFVY